MLHPLPRLTGINHVRQLQLKLHERSDMSSYSVFLEHDVQPKRHARELLADHFPPGSNRPQVSATKQIQAVSRDAPPNPAGRLRDLHFLRLRVVGKPETP